MPDGSPPHRARRWRRRAKWAGMVACALSAILTIVTIAFDAAIYRYSNNDIQWISIRASAIEVCRVVDRPVLPPAERTAYWQVDAGGSYDWGFTARPSVSNTPSEFSLTVPLWIGFFAVAIATVLMFLADRRRPSGCANCNYDLSGLPPGPCPECGGDR